MLILRDVFTAKPGQASKLAGLFKRVFGQDPAVTVMTDLVSGFNTVIMDRKIKDLGEYEAIVKMYRSGKPGPNMDPNAFKEMEGYTDLYESGRREILQIVD
jgi:hypothetical protein